MNTEPNSSPPPLPPHDDPAAAAKAQAKALADQASQAFQGLDSTSRIYVIALAVTALCSLIFGAIAVKVDLGKEMNEIAKVMGSAKAKTSQTSHPLVGAGFFGGLSFLSAAAGIALTILGKLKFSRAPWVPLALAGSACLCALCILIVRMQGVSGASEASAMGGMVKISVDGTFLGFWLPLAGAITAAVVSVRRIVRA